MSLNPVDVNLTHMSQGIKYQSMAPCIIVLVFQNASRILFCSNSYCMIMDGMGVTNGTFKYSNRVKPMLYFEVNSRGSCFDTTFPHLKVI